MRKYYAALDDDAWPVQMGLRCVFGRRDYRPALDQPGGTRRSHHGLKIVVVRANHADNDADDHQDRRPRSDRRPILWRLGLPVPFNKKAKAVLPSSDALGVDGGFPNVNSKAAGSQPSDKYWYGRDVRGVCEAN